MCKTDMGGKCPHKTVKNVGLLALRIAIGVIFVYMGQNKLWAGHAGATAMFDRIGLIGGGNFWAYFVGTFEFVGGLMVLLGAYLRFAAIWLALIMVVAMLTVHSGGPFAGYFLPLAVLGGCLALLGTGAGRYRVIKCECCCKECRAMCEGGGCGGACGGHGGECGCKNCCGGSCPSGAPNGQCACCTR